MSKINIREHYNIDLAKLKPTHHLLTKLPMPYEFAIETKEDGQRFSLQIGPDGCFLISRSRRFKTKGVDKSRCMPFVDRQPEIWMTELKSDVTVILDGELRVMAEHSTSSEVTKSDTDKCFVVFDCLWLSHDIREQSNGQRFEIARDIVQTIAHPRLRMVTRDTFQSLDESKVTTLLDILASNALEGFVLKRTDLPYDKNNYGWKVKRNDTTDGFIIDCAEEKKHNHSKVTKTGRVGSALVAWIHPTDKHRGIAWVPLPDKDRCPLSACSVLSGRVLKFSHFGWDGKLFRFPAFVEWHIDKTPDDCDQDKRSEFSGSRLFYNMRRPENLARRRRY